MNPRFAWPAVALVAVAMVVVGAMAIAQVPLETIVVVVGLLVTPVLTVLVGAQVAQVGYVAHANQVTTAQVQQQVNGNQAHLIDALERATQLLAASAPAAELPASAAAPATPSGVGSASTA